MIAIFLFKRLPPDWFYSQINPAAASYRLSPQFKHLCCFITYAFFFFTSYDSQSLIRAKTAYDFFTALPTRFTAMQIAIVITISGNVFPTIISTVIR